MVQPLIQHKMSDEKVTCRIEIEPIVELLSPKIDFGTGERNRGLKILSVKYRDQKIVVNTEGLAGEDYLINVVNSDKIADLDGGLLENDAIKISIPKGEYGKFINHVITIDTK